MKRVAVAALFPLAALFLAGRAAAAGLPLRYNLTVGSRLHYSSKSESKYARGARGQVRTTEVWVVGQNPDLTWHLVLRRASTAYRVDSAGKRTDGEPQVEWARCDLAPDGTASGIGSTGSLDPATIFALLTAGSGRDTLRERFDAKSGERTRYTTLGLTEPYGAVMIRAEYLTPLDSIYLISSHATFYFDTRRELISHKDLETEQKWGPFAGKTESMTFLDSVTRLDTTKARKLDLDLAVFLEADSVYGALLDRASENAAARNVLIDSAQAVMDSGRAHVTDAVVRTMFDDEVGTLEERVRQMEEDQSWRDSLIGMPAPAWTLEDLEGRKHSLADFKGRVVILDFWYRGCPWCIRAMPTLNVLERQFGAKALAVIGMNNDKDIADARFVVGKLGLEYLNLRSGDLYKKYGVSGFPTLFVVDGKGRIHDIHVGYSPDLKEKLSRSVRNAIGED